MLSGVSHIWKISKKQNLSIIRDLCFIGSLPSKRETPNYRQQSNFEKFPSIFHLIPAIARGQHKTFLQNQRKKVIKHKFSDLCSNIMRL